MHVYTYKNLDWLHREQTKYNNYYLLNAENELLNLYESEFRVVQWELELGVNMLHVLM